MESILGASVYDKEISCADYSLVKTSLKARLVEKIKSRLQDVGLTQCTIYRRDFKNHGLLAIVMWFKEGRGGGGGG